MTAAVSILTDYQMLFESVPNLYVVFTPDFRIVAASKKYLAATKIDLNVVLGHNVFDVFSPQSEEDTTLIQLKNSLVKVAETGVEDTMPVVQYNIPTEDGRFEERYWSPCNFPIFDEQGELIYIIQRVEDVTEFILLRQKKYAQKHGDISLSDRTEQMESEVYIRAQKISENNRSLEKENDQLAHMFEELQKLDELKMHFFANVSHELRTPLTLILGPTSTLLSSGKFSGEERFSLEIIQRNAQLLLRQVNDILEISKLEAGKVDLEYTNADMPHLVEEVASNFKLFAKENNIQLIVNVCAFFYAEVDVPKLQRILLNLLSNAFKFTPKGGKIELILTRIEDQVILTVQDTGPGIPEHMQEAIFERFRQVDDPSQRYIRGTGLGLAIVKEFVYLHQGNIKVENCPKGGAAFKLILPVKAAAQNAHIVENATSLPDDEIRTLIATELSTYTPNDPVISTPTTNKQGALVLIIEDNIDMNDFLNRILAEHYNIITAYNGKEGLEKALQHLPDLIISDIMMPEMTGNEMAQALFAHSSTRHIPILILTAKMDDPLKISLLKKGIQDYISKPFSAEELYLKVTRLITERKKRIMEHEQLIQKLTASNRELQRFAYIASHDLKSPLRSIDNLSQWIEEELGKAIKGRSKSYMEQLRDQVHLMEKLLDNVLEYSAIEYNIQQKATTIDSTTLLDKIIEILKPPENFTIKLNNANYPLHVHIVQLQQVLYHLIQNAIKHHDKEEGVIEINIEEDEMQYIFSVRDDGPGIKLQYHNKIFDMFQTLKPRSQTGDLGVGLTFVKKIISIYGKEITVESEQGHGALFKFTWNKIKKDLGVEKNA